MGRLVPSRPALKPAAPRRLVPLCLRPIHATLLGRSAALWARRLDLSSHAPHAAGAWSFSHAPLPRICVADPSAAFLVAPPQARWIQEQQAPLLPPAAHAINQTGGDRAKPHAPPPPPLPRDASPAAAAAASEGAWGLGKPHGPPPPPLPRDASPAAAATGCFGRAPLCLPLLPAASPVPKVHVWYLCPDELNDQSQLNMYEELLSPDERKYAASMKVPALRKDAMLSRALLRTTLSRYTDCKIDPRSFEFKKNEFGKPEILWPPDNSVVERPLHFNISHTTSLIACGIAVHAHIGIDIEEKKRNTTKNILSLARRYFTPSEVDYLIAISDSDVQRKEFLKLWTLKEAYVKALGLGFSGAPFNTFSIMLETSKGIKISKVSKVCDDSISGFDQLSDNWQFTLAELNSSHYMSVCIEDDSRKQGLENTPVPVGLKVWKTVPFVEDTLVSGTDALKLIS